MEFKTFYSKNIPKTIQVEINCVIEINLPHIDYDPIFCFGGDGTFLDAVQKYGHNYTYIPINMGTLGFYTSWLLTDLEDICKNIKSLSFYAAPLLKITFLKNNINYEKYSLNETTIINPIRTQILDIAVDGFDFESFRGTGVCISTPSGSTAYNKSLSGSILAPDLQLFQLTKIAPINNKYFRCIENPIILSNQNSLTFTSKIENFKNSILSVDRQITKLNGVDEINITLSDKKIKLLHKNDYYFWEKTKDSFL